MKAVEAVKRDKFIEASLKGDKDMFEELRKIKKSGNSGLSKMDGKTNEDDIADHFGEIYKNIYNRDGSDEPLKNLFDEVSANCSHHDLADLDKVTGELIIKCFKSLLFA